jgi:hypothetical protein
MSLTHIEVDDEEVNEPYDWEDEIPEEDEVIIPKKDQIQADMEQNYEPRIFPYSEWMRQYFRFLS